MNVLFSIRGRLGNAIIRYMASCILCIEFGATYYTQHDSIPNNSNETIVFSDDAFLTLSNHLLNNKPVILNSNMIMWNFYQTSSDIYNKYKKQIIQFINNNPHHVIITDGILAGDNNSECFFMKEIINTLPSFSKIYKNVLHLRLEDFVTNNLYIRQERIIALINNITDIDTLCIVCKNPTTPFEFAFLEDIKNVLISKNITVSIQHNDVITDFNIIKNAEVIICSNSTLCWVGCFFSEKLKKCYYPEESSNFKNITFNTQTY